MKKSTKSKPTKVVKPALVRPKVTKTAPRKKTPPAKPQKAPEAPMETVAANATVPQVPSQGEESPPQPQVPREISAEGNNIANVQDRAFADTHPANDQPPVEKTFVSPPDNP